MNSTLKLLAACSGALLATGCANLPPAAPNVDAGFGASVRQAMSAQTANPAAGRNAGSPQGFDAQSAVLAIARHRSTFKEPPPTITLVGIGSPQ